MLAAAGHEALLIDAHLEGLGAETAAERVAAFAPAMTVVTTAPTYLFWRCAPPELRVPRAFLDTLAGRGGTTVAVGPHGSATPRPVLDKLGCDIVVRGECEEVVARLAGLGDLRPETLRRVPALAFRDGAAAAVTGPPHAGRFTDLPALRWPQAWIARHRHHHHRFDAAPDGRGRGRGLARLPLHLLVLRQDRFPRRLSPPGPDPRPRRDRRADRAGVTYVYFVDEIFLPQKPLLEALVARDLRFGIQTRIDLLEARTCSTSSGRRAASPSRPGSRASPRRSRAALDKRCRASTDDLAERLIHARRSVPFVQANLIAMAGDDPDLVATWRDRLRGQGVWANDPVPLYPYPSSPITGAFWGEPDDRAWERAHAHYLGQFTQFSDIQDERPLPLPELEAACGCC
ncbi:TIGR04295 family B12-binding domain-containing radical SAM protein [Methylobacterium oryzae CBMB20]